MSNFGAVNKLPWGLLAVPILFTDLEEPSLGETSSDSSLMEKFESESESFTGSDKGVVVCFSSFA